MRTEQIKATIAAYDARIEQTAADLKRMKEAKAELQKSLVYHARQERRRRK
jgi:hypothetical protein